MVRVWVRGHLVCLHFGALRDHAAVKICVQVFVDVLLPLWGTHLAVELLGHTETLCGTI